MKHARPWIPRPHDEASIIRAAAIVVLCLLAGAGVGCSSATAAGKMTFNFIDYHRGISAPSPSDVEIATTAGRSRLYDVALSGDSLFPDDSVIPNAFLKPLLRLDVKAALNAFTEPYYGYRIQHFLSSRPHWGVGVEFTHLKAFMADPRQQVKVTGAWPNVSSDGRVVLGDAFDTLNISHGVNHVTLNGVYRWMLLPSARMPDGRLQPFVSPGAGIAVPHLELTAKQDGELQRKAYSYQLRLGNWAVGTGAGVRWKITPRFGAYGEYKWTYSILDNMHFDNGEEGQVSMRFWSHHAIWGVSFGL